jgi:hypothetical protein
MTKVEPSTYPENHMEDDSLRTLNRLVCIAIVVTMAVVVYVYSSQAGWALPTDITEKMPLMDDVWAEANQVYNNIAINVKEIIALVSPSLSN